MCIRDSKEIFSIVRKLYEEFKVLESNKTVIVIGYQTALMLKDHLQVHISFSLDEPFSLMLKDNYRVYLSAEIPPSHFSVMTKGQYEEHFKPEYSQNLEYLPSYSFTLPRFTDQRIQLERDYKNSIVIAEIEGKQCNDDIESVAAAETTFCNSCGAEIQPSLSDICATCDELVNAPGYGKI
jgi:hypothetical protein